MDWTNTKAQIWLSSADFAWERKFDGLTQRLNVVATDDGPMHLFASQWFLSGQIRSFKLDNVARHFVIDQSEITNLWNLAYFGGESV